MPGQSVPLDVQHPPNTPLLGTLPVGINHADRVGVFRGITGPHCLPRPLCGRPRRKAEPVNLRPKSATEQLHAEIARRNARRRGAVL